MVTFLVDRLDVMCLMLVNDAMTVGVKFGAVLYDNFRTDFFSLPF